MSRSKRRDLDEEIENQKHPNGCPVPFEHDAEGRTLFFRATEKSFTSNLPRFTFPGRVYIISNEREVVRAIRAIRMAPIVGLDTETRPSFRRGETHKVALLQVSTPEECFLFRLNHLGLPDAIVAMLEDPAVLKIGLSLNDDFRMLSKRKPVKPQGYVELQTLAAEMGFEDMSLLKLFANIFHQRISKRSRLSNWEATPLTTEQQIYAATDAYACIVLYERLQELKASGNFAFIERETAPSDALAAEANGAAETA